MPRAHLTCTTLITGLICTSAPAFAAEYASRPCLSETKIAAARQELVRVDHENVEPYASLLAEMHRLNTAAREIDAKAIAFNRACNRPLDKGSAEDRHCAGQQAVLKASIDSHDRSVATVNSDAHGLVATIPALAQRTEGIRRQLVTISRDARMWTSETEEWIKLGRSARLEARHQAVAAILDLATEKLRSALDRDERVATSISDGYNEWFEKNAQTIPKDMRAALQARIAGVRTKRDILNLLTYVGEQEATFAAVTKAANGGEWTQVSVELIKHTLKIADAMHLLGGESNPAIQELALGVTVAEIVAASWNGWSANLVANGHLFQLIRLQEQDLTNLNRLGNAYVKGLTALRWLRNLETTCSQS